MEAGDVDQRVLAVRRSPRSEADQSGAPSRREVESLAPERAVGVYSEWPRTPHKSSSGPSTPT